MKARVWYFLVVSLVFLLSKGNALAEKPASQEESAARSAINRHAQVLVREANVMELVQRAERAVFYLQKAGGDVKDLEQLIEKLNTAVTECQELLQARMENPKVDSLDYAKINGLLSEIEKQASEVLEKSVPRFAKAFPWYSKEKAGKIASPMIAQGQERPRQESKQGEPSQSSKQDFVRSFPITLRVDDFGARPDQPESMREFSYYFGKGNWDVFAPVRFDAVNPHPWMNPMVEMEVGEGKFDFSALDRLIETNTRRGYPTDIDVQFHGFPAWMKEKYGSQIEEMYLVDRDGNIDTRGEIQDFWRPEVMSHITAALKALGEHYCDNPNVSMYELVNEPELTVPRKGPASYSKAAKQAFRDFLRIQYADLDSLNALWGTKYETFEAIEPPAGVTRSEPSEPAGLLYDFARFRLESFTNYFRRIVTTLQQADPNHPVCSQFLVPGGYPGENFVRDAVDLLGLVDVPWDLFGTHDWIGAGPAVDPCMINSFNRYGRRTLWMDELTWSWWLGADEKREADDEQVVRARAERNLWRQLAWGKRGFTLYVLDEQWANWDNNLVAIGTGSVAAPEPQLGGGPAAQNPVGDTNLRYAGAAFPVQREKCRALGNTLWDAEIVFSPVGVLYSDANQVFSPPADFTAKQRLFTELLPRHTVPRLIPDKCILDGRENLQDIKVLFAPSVTYVRKGLDKAILDWVKRGGTLITLGSFAQFDAYGHPLQSFEQITKTSGGQETTKTENIKYGSGEIQIFPQEDVSGFLEHAVEATDPLKSADSDVAVRHATIEGQRRRPQETCLSDLELLPLRSGDRELLIAINLNAEKPLTPTVRRKGNFDHVVELTGRGSLPVPSQTKNGWTEIELSLSPGTAVVLDFSAVNPS